MTRDKAKRLREAAAQAEEQAMARIHSGELEHLRGKPLDLSDDSPDWFVNKLLKREGFSHPLLERSKELEVVAREPAIVLENLRRRQAALIEQQGSPPTPQQVEAFNAGREDSLRDYRDALLGLNRAIMFHNLAVPESLHRKPVQIEDAVRRVTDEIPALQVLPEPPPQQIFWVRVVRRLKRRTG